MSDYEGTYAIRIHRLARRDIDEAINHTAALTDEKYATEWHDGLLDKLATLAALPKRGPIAESVYNKSARNPLTPNSGGTGKEQPSYSGFLSGSPELGRGAIQRLFIHTLKKTVSLELK